MFTYVPVLVYACLRVCNAELNMWLDLCSCCFNVEEPMLMIVQHMNNGLRGWWAQGVVVRGVACASLYELYPCLRTRMHHATRRGLKCAGHANQAS